VAGAELTQQQPPVAVAGAKDPTQLSAGELATRRLGLDKELAGAIPGRRIPWR
jgi:hypothetical protein